MKMNIKTEELIKIFINSSVLLRKSSSSFSLPCHFSTLTFIIKASSQNKGESKGTKNIKTTVSGNC